MDAAEAVAQIFRKGFGELVDGQAGSIGREDGMRAHERRNLFIQV